MNRDAATAAAVGGLVGLTWAAGVREYMASLAGNDSKVNWYGTFGTILVPAAVIGAVFGWAEHRRASGEDLPHRRALAAAPLALAVLPLTRSGAVTTLRTTGEGSAGAAAVTLVAIGGGYALGGGGPAWTRLTAGAVAAATALGAGASVPFIGGKRLALSTPRGVLTGVLGVASMLTLAVAASVPFRGRPRSPSARVRNVVEE